MDCDVVNTGPKLPQAILCAAIPGAGLAVPRRSRQDRRLFT